eukprot:1143893-Ditylum_brightwellii.AAC.1
MREERYGRERDGDDAYDKEYGSRKKAMRLGSFWQDKKDFVVAHNAKKQHGKSTANLTVPKQFKRWLKERETQGQKGRDDEKIARR